MDNISFVIAELKKGNDVYLADTYEDFYFHFTPELGANKVFAKKPKGGIIKERKVSDEDVFESLLGADVIKKWQF